MFYFEFQNCYLQKSKKVIIKLYIFFIIIFLDMYIQEDNAVIIFKVIIFLSVWIFSFQIWNVIACIIFMIILKLLKSRFYITHFFLFRQ